MSAIAEQASFSAAEPQQRVDLAAPAGSGMLRSIGRCTVRTTWNAITAASCILACARRWTSLWLYHVFSSSFQDVELLLAERSVIVSYESVRLN